MPFHILAIYSSFILVKIEPRCCIVAGCITVSGEGYSLHEFPRDKALHAKWVQAVNCYRNKWDGPLTSSVLCSKHFEPEYFVLDGIRYHDPMEIPAK